MPVIIRTLDLNSGGRGFKSHFDHLAGVVSLLGPMLVNNQLVFLPPAGIFKPIMLS